MDVPADGARSKAAEIREAATTLRGLVPAFSDTPISEFVPVAVAKVLEGVAESVERGEPVRDQITAGALEIARHLRTYRPPESAEVSR